MHVGLQVFSVACEQPPVLMLHASVVQGLASSQFSMYVGAHLPVFASQALFWVHALLSSRHLVVESTAHLPSAQMLTVHRSPSSHFEPFWAEL